MPSRLRTGPAPRVSTARVVIVCALVLVAAQTVVRTWVAAGSGFYWDDLILAGRGATLPLWSPDLLAYSHDGHFMPAAFWTAAVSTSIAPYEWVIPAVTLVLGQLAVSLAMLRLLFAILGARPALLIPLTFYLFVPLTIPGFTWWAAALNSLPLQFALGWVSADAIRLYRTGRTRCAMSGIAVFTMALLFFEKAVVVPVVAFATAALAVYVGTTSPLSSVARRLWRRGRTLWIGMAAVLAVWLVAFLSVPLADNTHVTLPSPERLWGLVYHGTSYGLLPTLLGGPWSWERWLPGPPWAAPDPALVIAAWIVVTLALIAVLYYKRRLGWVWAGAAAYFLVSVAVMALTRWSDDTAYELAQTLRYFTDTAVILTIAMALSLRARARKPLPVNGFGRAAAATAVGAAFVVSSLISTVSYVRCWQQGPTPAYLDTAREALATHRGAPLLDQQAPIEILMPVTHPNNWLSTVLAPLRDRPKFADSTTELRLFDAQGHLVDGQVLWMRSIQPGSNPGCDHRIEGTEWTTVPLSEGLIGWHWVAQLNYLATDDGEIEVTFADSTEPPVVVDVSAGPGTVYAALTGGGASIHIRPITPGLAVCLAPGPVGPIAPR
ncbi:MAG: hypothetical protein GX542_04625 [Rhodococcus sp.]|nr:hypothetical protein [Rhodococcus sp. (in: high G+C Gram-positive bacteria)]